MPSESAAVRPCALGVGVSESRLGENEWSAHTLRFSGERPGCLKAACPNVPCSVAGGRTQTSARASGLCVYSPAPAPILPEAKHARIEMLTYFLSVQGRTQGTGREGRLGERMRGAAGGPGLRLVPNSGSEAAFQARIEDPNYSPRRSGRLCSQKSIFRSSLKRRGKRTRLK